MSKSGHSSPARLTAPSSHAVSKAHPISQDLLPQPTDVAALNVLFLGETSIGESSIVDLIAGSGERKRTPHQSGCRDDACSIALGGRAFMLRALPANESPTLRERIQNTLTDLRRSGGVHLLVYCMNALRSSKWIHDVHHTIVSHSTLSPHVPAVAVVVGISNVTEGERWWSRTKDDFVEKGPRFDDHAFIRMAAGTRTPTEEHISESRRLLHALILHNCVLTPNSATESDHQSQKPPSHISTNSKAIDVVLLGEIGVGKSSLINLIARKDVAEVSSDTVGCTKTAIKYTFEEKGRTFHLYDTPGLVDPQMGIEPFIHPIDIIQRLIYSLGNGNGPDLLLFCIDNSKPTASLRRNYRLFCNIICGGKSSSALAITKLEKVQDVDEWWGRHGTTIRRYGIDSGHFGLARKRHSGSDADLERSRESLLSFLVACTDRQKNRVKSLRSSVARSAISMTSFLRQTRTPEKALMNQCGLEEQTARELASRIVSSMGSRKDGVPT